MQNLKPDDRHNDRVKWVADLADGELLWLAEAVDAERRKRRRGNRNLVWNPERRQWDRRAM